MDTQDSIIVTSHNSKKHCASQQGYNVGWFSGHFFVVLKLFFLLCSVIFDLVHDVDSEAKFHLS